MLIVGGMVVTILALICIGGTLSAHALNESVGGNV